ncbi:MAG: hypothetical protein FJ314_06485 [SAR202 cluster bacterium]|nr:hypothetical protein [SAR202 cluster bacterium]
MVGGREAGLRPGLADREVKRRRTLAWAGGFLIPVLAWCGLIFWVSSRTASQLQDATWVPALAEIAHFGAYLVLAILVWRLLASVVRSSGVINVRDLVVANLTGAASFAYALSDEYHQTFVPGRAFSVEDLAVDLAGIVTGTGLALAFRYRRARRSSMESSAALHSPAGGTTI